jgi:hypothetical protein
MGDCARERDLRSGAGLLALWIVLWVSVISMAGDSGAGSEPAGSQKPLSGQQGTIQWDEPEGRVDHAEGALRGQLNAGTVMADLLPLNGRLILAATDGRTIQVLEADKGLRGISNYDPGTHGQILSLKWWRPSAQQPLYLAVLAWLEDKLAAAVLVLKNDRLERVVDGLETILGAFDTDADGLPETLLGQDFEPQTFFGRRIVERYWVGDKLATRRPALDLPHDFTVIGGQLADLTGDGKPEAIHVSNGILRIAAGGKTIYTSAKQMGGSLSVLTYKMTPDAKDYITTSAFFEVSPMAMDIDADGRLELVAVASSPSTFKVPGLVPTIEESRLMVFKYRNDGAFLRGTFGEPVPAAIQGLAGARGRVWYVTCEPGHAQDGQHGTSRLAFFSLPE